MTVTELVTALVALQRKGFGDRRVMDENGNDVMETHAPCEEDHGEGTCESVVLTAYIDYGKVEA